MSQPVTLITGASAGLGAEFSRQLSAAGHRLILAARRTERIAGLAAELGNARAVTSDLSQPGAAAALMRDIETAGEHIDVLVNNAGIGLHGSFAELDAARQREMIDLNIGTLTDLCRAVVPGMIARGRGGILNVASTAAFQAGPGMAVYFATKAYVLSLSEALHVELRPHGIRVTALCPGPTRTEFGEVAGFNRRFAGAFDRVAMTSPRVVAAGLAGLARNRAVVVPGSLNKVSAAGTRFIPRPLLRKIASAMTS